MEQNASHTYEQDQELLDNREVQVLLSREDYRRAVKRYTEASTDDALAAVPVCGATIDINSLCNFRCRNCIDQASVNQTHLPAEMAWPVLKNLVCDLHAQGCRFIEPMGGETMLYSAYDRFLTLAARLDIALKIVTNGSLAHLHMPALVAASRVMGSSIRFSINGDANTYGLLTRTQNPEGVFKQVLDNISQLVKEDVRVLVSYVVLPENAMTIHSTAKFVKEKGASEFLVLPGRDWKTKKIQIVVDAALERELNRTRLLGDEGFHVNIPQTFNDGGEVQMKTYRRCALAFFKPVIGVEGYLYPCSYFKQRTDLVLGRIDSSSSFKDVWQSELRVRKLKNLRPDKKCIGVSCTRHYLNRFVDGVHAGELDRMDCSSSQLLQERFF